MSYQISGLSPEPFESLFDMDDDELAVHNAVRVKATGPGFPCRITLEDAPAGEDLILLHHLSHDVQTPYRSAYAIYVRANVDAARYIDEVPPVFNGRPIALRGFDAFGILRDASLALPGEADSKIRALLENEDIDYIHAHNAAHGCFSARIDRTN